MEQKGEYINIEIEDTGVGISEEDKERIYEPLFTARTKGTGLGLAIVNQYINNHNGEIEVKSEVGKGTLFTVKIPLKQEK